LLNNVAQLDDVPVYIGTGPAPSQRSRTMLTNWDDISKCEQSYIDYLAAIETLTFSNFFTSTGKITTTNIFETLESYGESELYTVPCDGIPRLRFLSPPTATVTKTVTQRETSTLYKTDAQLAVGPAGAPSAPACYANKEYCDLQLARKRMHLMGVDAKDSSKKEPFYLNGIFGEFCPYHPGVDSCFLKYEAEVMLMFWPPQIENRDICGSDGYGSGTTITRNVSNMVTTVTTSAITFAGQNLYLLANRVGSVDPWSNATRINRIEPSVLPGPFTFTFPTVYMAHRDIFRVSTYGVLGPNPRRETTLGKTSLAIMTIIVMYNIGGSIELSYIG
jgi:hypothetical protein